MSTFALLQTEVPVSVRLLYLSAANSHSRTRAPTEVENRDKAPFFSGTGMTCLPLENEHAAGSTYKTATFACSTVPVSPRQGRGGGWS